MYNIHNRSNSKWARALLELQVYIFMTSVIHCSGQVECLWLQWYIAEWKSAWLQQFLAECNKFARL